MLQEIIVFLIVGVAAAYLARRFWQTFTVGKKCGGCGSACGGKTPSQPTQLVQIQMSVKPKPPERG